jgi:hypothetical protein
MGGVVTGREPRQLTSPRVLVSLPPDTLASVRAVARGSTGTFVAVVLAALVVPLAACGDGSKISATQLRLLVLQPSDVTSDFVRFDVGPIGRFDVRPGARDDPSRFGRQGGWKSRYKRTGTATAGPLLVISMVDVFGSDDSARDDLDAYAQEFDRLMRGRHVTIRDLGDDAKGVTFTQGSGRYATRFFKLAWREGNATASVSVDGREGRLGLGEVTSLARKQDARLRRSLRGT